MFRFHFVVIFSCLSRAQDIGLRRECDTGDHCYRCRDDQFYYDPYRKQVFCCLTSRQCGWLRFQNHRCYCDREEGRSSLTGSNNEIVSSRQDVSYSQSMDMFIQGTGRLEKAMKMIHNYIENLDYRVRQLESGSDRDPIVRSEVGFKESDYSNNERSICSSGFLSLSLSCWYFSENAVTWDEAREECSRRKSGAELAYFGTKREYDTLLQHLDNNYPYSDGYWINSRRDVEKGWIWRSTKTEDGIFRMWSSWDRGDPSFDALRDATPAGPCLVMKAEKITLQPAACDTKKTYICRYTQ